MPDIYENDSKLSLMLLGGFLVVALASAGYIEGIKKPQLVAEAKLVEMRHREAVSGADEKIKKIFKEWSAISVDSNGAVEWSGAASEILYIEYLAPLKNVPNDVESWRVWARGKGGTLFAVSLWLDDQYQWRITPTAQKMSDEVFINTLVSNKREDIIRELNFPLKPA